ncbi:MAG: VTT domain-containing protein [Pyrinomonadaceae bacterium]
MDFFTQQFVEFGSAGILLALFFGTFVSEDLACISAGSLIAAGIVNPIAAVVVCFAGIVAGDVLLFGGGWLFGSRILDSSLGSRFVSKQDLDRASAWLASRGTSAIFISRFVSGLRLPTYFLSGVLRLDAKRFVLFVAIAAAIWTPALIVLAAVWHMTIPFGLVGGFVALLIVFRLAFHMTDQKGRRMLAGRIKRIWNWEFWPLWLFYSPVVFYVLYLAIRFRELHFTAANPGIPSGGFVGESKDAIYKLIASSDLSSRHLLRYVSVAANSDHEVRLRTALEFLAGNRISYPVILKPDAGERGNGVVVVRDESGLSDALRNATDVLVQEFVDGVEASIFYYRLPREQRGHIFSITEKVFPTVIGDGSSTLEELILNDPRAHIIAASYFKRNEGRLQDRPRLGQKVQLVEIGAHSKGTIFRDGGWMRSEALQDAIDRLSCEIPGFYFGRYDIRAASFEELSVGNFKIIELNGVTSESTNIYDPRYSLFDAYKTLFSQWRIAFEIGQQNAERGASRTSVRDLIRLVLGSKQPI